MAILKLLQGAVINRLYVNTNKKVESLPREMKATETNWNFKTKKYSNTKHSKQKSYGMGLTLGWRGQKNQWIWRFKKKRKLFDLNIREKINGEKKKSLKYIWQCNKRSNVCVIRVSGERRKKCKARKMLEEIVAKCYPNLA